MIEIESLADCNIYIVPVPVSTPIEAHKRPNLTSLIKASETVDGVLKRSGVVIYESSGYSGATEEGCIPVLEWISGLRFNVGFLLATVPNELTQATRSTPALNL